MRQDAEMPVERHEADARLITEAFLQAQAQKGPLRLGEGRAAPDARWQGGNRAVSDRSERLKA